MGSNTSNKRGVDINTTTGSFAASYCSFHEFVVSGSTVRSNTSNSNIAFSHCVFYNMQSWCLNLDNATGTSVSVSDCVAIRSTSTDAIVLPWNIAATDLRAAGANSHGITIQSGSATGSFNGLVSHSNGNRGLNLNTASGPVTLSNITAWRGGSDGISTTGTLTNVTIDTFTVFGFSSQGVYVNGNLQNVVFLNGTVRAGTVLTQPIGLRLDTSVIDEACFVNCVFGGGGQTHATADVSLATAITLTYFLLDNCALSSSTQLANQTNLRAVVTRPYSSLKANFLGQTQNHKTWFGNGSWSYDSSISDASPSLRMTPLSATVKLQSPNFIASVPSGQAATASIKVRKSVIGDGAAYNGNQPRLIVRRDYGAGITSETVLDTSTAAGDGAFETLTGTTSTVGANCALQFFVDCDGTAGWVNVDTFSITTA
jgi:hypothetical protein